MPPKSELKEPCHEDHADWHGLTCSKIWNGEVKHHRLTGHMPIRSNLILNEYPGVPSSNGEGQITSEFVNQAMSQKFSKPNMPKIRLDNDFEIDFVKVHVFFSPLGLPTQVELNMFVVFFLFCHVWNMIACLSSCTFAAQTSLVSLSLTESPCSFLLTAFLLSMICQILPVVSCGFMWQNTWFRCSVAPSDIRNVASPALMLASLSSNPWVPTRFERHADAPPLCIRRMILRELTQGHARVLNIVLWFSSDFKSQCTWIITY